MTLHIQLFAVLLIAAVFSDSNGDVKDSFVDKTLNVQNGRGRPSCFLKKVDEINNECTLTSDCPLFQTASLAATYIKRSLTIRV